MDGNQEKKAAGKSRLLSASLILPKSGYSITPVSILS